MRCGGTVVGGAMGDMVVVGTISPTSGWGLVARGSKYHGYQLAVATPRPTGAQMRRTKWTWPSLGMEGSR